MGSVQKGGGGVGLIVVAVGMNFSTLDLLKDYLLFFSKQSINAFNPYTILLIHHANPFYMFFQDDIVHIIMLFMLYHI